MLCMATHGNLIHLERIQIIIHTLMRCEDEQRRPPKINNTSDDLYAQIF